LVSKFLNIVDKTNDIGNWALGSLFQRGTNESYNFSSCILINAWNDGDWIGKFVLFKSSIQS
jgi:hypothetical protein